MSLVIDDPEIEEILRNIAAKQGISPGEALRAALEEPETPADLWRRSLKDRARTKRLELADAVRADRKRRQGRAA